MNEEEIERLYQELTEAYGVPMPTYIFYERRPKVIMPKVIPESWAEQVQIKITVSKQIGVHFQLRGDDISDPFGFIMLSKGTRGILKDEAVHEFFHYYDYLMGRPVDEKLTRSRTRKYMKDTRVPLRGTP